MVRTSANLKDEPAITTDADLVPSNSTRGELEASVHAHKNDEFIQTEIFGSKRLTGALLDRITHHVYIMEMNGIALNASQQKSLKKHETLCQPAYQANRRGSQSSISSEPAPRRCPAFIDPSAPA